MFVAHNAVFIVYVLVLIGFGNIRENIELYQRLGRHSQTALATDGMISNFEQCTAISGHVQNG